MSYLSVKPTEPVQANMEIPAIKAQARELVAIGLRRGWIKPATVRPLTEAQIDAARKMPK